MIYTGKIELNNNYWMDMMDGTWSCWADYYDVVLQKFDNHAVLYIQKVKHVEMLSTDSGKTHTINKEKDVHGENAIVMINPHDVNEEINANLNINGDKKITWLEELKQVI